MYSDLGAPPSFLLSGLGRDCHSASRGGDPAAVQVRGEDGATVSAPLLSLDFVWEGDFCQLGRSYFCGESHTGKRSFTGLVTHAVTRLFARSVETTVALLTCWSGMSCLSSILPVGGGESEGGDCCTSMRSADPDTQKLLRPGSRRRLPLRTPCGFWRPMPVTQHWTLLLCGSE